MVQDVCQMCVRCTGWCQMYKMMSDGWMNAVRRGDGATDGVCMCVIGWCQVCKDVCQMNKMVSDGLRNAVRRGDRLCDSVFEARVRSPCSNLSSISSRSLLNLYQISTKPRPNLY